MVKLERSNTPIDLTTDDNVITNTDIVYPKKDGNLLLMQQPARVQEVCCAAISKILIDICFTHAFPDSLKMTFVRAALIECANALQYTDIEKHLCKDISYADTLSKLVSGVASYQVVYVTNSNFVYSQLNVYTIFVERSKRKQTALSVVTTNAAQDARRRLIGCCKTYTTFTCVTPRCIIN